MARVKVGKGSLKGERKMLDREGKEKGFARMARHRHRSCWIDQKVCLRRSRFSMTLRQH